MENILGWRSQFERMDRWYQRIVHQQAVPGRNDDADADILDLYLAFFLNCYSLRDWFVKSGAISDAVLAEAIKSSPDMQLCRDLCNRSKHMSLDRQASVDAGFSILREYRGQNRPNALVIIAADTKRDLFDVVGGCQQFWKDFVRTHQPPESTVPFR